MPAAKTESAEAVRRTFVASVISLSYVWACLHRAGTQGFSPLADWGRDRGCPARGFGCPVRGRRAPNGLRESRGRSQSPRAGFGQMFKTYDGDLRAAVELGRLKAAVAGDDLFVLIDQNGRIEAERFDAPSDGSNLSPIMLTRVALIGLQIGGREKS